MRLASLSPAITEILFRFGVEKDIVCTDHFSDYPDEVQQIPHLKDHQAIAVEAVLDYEPELVFTSTVVQAKLAEQLKAEDVAVVHFDPRCINDTYNVIRQLGMLLQVEERASTVIREMQEGFNDVKRKAHVLEQSSVQGRLKLYIEEWPGSADASPRPSPAFASGNWVPEIARIAGGEQLPQAKAGELSPQVTLKQVQQWQPDIVVLSWCGAGTAIDAKRLFLEREGWNQLTEEKFVYVIDDSLLNRHGPRLVEGAQRLYGWMFERLH